MGSTTHHTDKDELQTLSYIMLIVTLIIIAYWLEVGGFRSYLKQDNLGEAREEERLDRNERKAPGSKKKP